MPNRGATPACEGRRARCRTPCGPAIDPELAVHRGRGRARSSGRVPVRDRCAAAEAGGGNQGGSGDVRPPEEAARSADHRGPPPSAGPDGGSGALAARTLGGDARRGAAGRATGVGLGPGSPGSGRDGRGEWDGVVGRDRRQRRPAAHRGRPRRRGRRAAVGAIRVSVGAGLADPPRRCARRPVWPAPGLRDRHCLVRRRLAAVRRRAEHRGARRGRGSSRGSAQRCSRRAAWRSSRRASGTTTAHAPSGRGPD